MINASEVAAMIVVIIAITAVVYQTGVLRGKISETCHRVHALEEFRKNDILSVYKKLDELSIQVARIEAKLE